MTTIFASMASLPSCSGDRSRSTVSQTAPVLFVSQAETESTQDAYRHRGMTQSSVKRCRIVKDRIRLWKAGIRDRVMELCCALHNFRVRLTPWQPMI